MYKPLKTKGFSPKTEAFYLIGGGENRTLVLGKLRIDHYMLSVLKKASLHAKRDIKTSLPHLILKFTPRGNEVNPIPSQ